MENLIFSAVKSDFLWRPLLFNDVKNTSILIATIEYIIYSTKRLILQSSSPHPRCVQGSLTLS